MFLLLTIGCAKPTPAATPTEIAPAPAEPAAQKSTAVPDAHLRLKALLQARHPEDLPDKAAMDAAGAPIGLHWLASNDDAMMIRERALLLLRSYPDDDSQALCATTFDSDAHAKLRAAAITCLAGSDLADDDTLRNKLLAAVRDPDPRVGVAAVGVLAEVPSARSGLKAAQDDPALTAPVRDALAALFD